MESIDTIANQLDGAGVPITWAILGGFLVAAIAAIAGGWFARSFFSGYISKRIDQAIKPFLDELRSLKSTFLEALKQSEKHRDSKIGELHGRLDSALEALHRHQMHVAETYMPKAEIGAAVGRIESAIVRVEARLNKQTNGH